jgi:hypothetical protein
MERWYFGVVVEEIRWHEARKRGRELPYPKDDIHYLLKKHFLPVEVLELGEITARFRDLTNAQKCDYIEAVRAYYANDGLGIPDPGEEPA